MNNFHRTVLLLSLCLVVLAAVPTLAAPQKSVTMVYYYFDG
jgi:hypothetical protein